MNDCWFSFFFNFSYTMACYLHMTPAVTEKTFPTGNAFPIFWACMSFSECVWGAVIAARSPSFVAYSGGRGKKEGGGKKTLTFLLWVYLHPVGGRPVSNFPVTLLWVRMQDGNGRSSRCKKSCRQGLTDSPHTNCFRVFPLWNLSRQGTNIQSEWFTHSGRPTQITIICFS